MIKNLFTDANWKRAALIVPVLLLSLFSTQAQSPMATDSILVKGVVVSGTNTPLSNITISIEGSRQMPAVTNEAGEFTIKSSAGDNWLIISPVSDFKTKRVFLNNRNQLKVFLTANDLAGGDDPLTILNQRMIKKDIISSYADMNSSDLYKTGAYSVNEFMQGRMAGVNVVRRDGGPGSGAVVNVRGANSLMTNTQPLYIIDGLPMETHGLIGSNLEGFSFDPLLSVNPLDITKVTVVKDPTVTAAYGTKASNGVVFIETLDPSATTTSIDVDLRSGYSMAPENFIPQMNAGQHKTFANEVLFSSGMFEETIRLKYPTLFMESDDDRFIDYQHNTNWQDRIFEDASFTNVNIKVKGGDAIARYGLSFGYTTSDGIVKTTGYDSYNLRFISRLNIFTWLRMHAGVGLNYSISNLKESGKVTETNPILSALGKSPMLNPFKYDIDGNMLTSLSEVDEIGVSNPVAIINKFEAKNTTYRFNTTMGFEGTINKNLMLNSNFGLTYNGIKEQIFMPNHGMDHYYNDEAWNVSKGTINYLLSFYNNTYFAYKKVINKVHNITSNTGLNLQTNKYQLDWAMGMNAHENDEYKALEDGLTNLRRIGGQNRNWNWVSFYEKFNYAFKDKYLLSAAVSLDGSSRVGDEAINTYKIADNPFGLFYSGGVGWRLSSEPLLKQISWLNELKVRASYGTSGNDDIGESNASDYYSSIKYRETVGLYPAIVPNKELSFETITTINGGVDISLWGNRVRGSVDYFQSTTDDMLILTPMKSYYGYSFRPENGGQLQNTGIEVTGFLRIVDGRSFKWDVQGNYTKIENEILELKGEQLISDVVGGEIVNQVGSPVNSFYGYIFQGVYTTAAEASAANLRNEKLNFYQSGDAKFVDLSGPNGTPDGIINEYDKTNIGSSMPDFYGGFQNTFTYKNWSLNTLVNFVSGNEVFNYVRYSNEKMTGLENQSANVLNRWQYEGQVTDVPRALWNDPVGNADFSTRWIEDGSYIRIQNVSLAYKIPNKFLTFRNAEFYVSANNVLTISKYLGYDPEFAGSYSHDEQGIDYGQTPQARQFIVGIKLGL
ncbi:MAG TPA: SusC/RagA family TonB-linked outer membrane protein [Prolixibacteraceae bacterium]|nr:SusC/RagA family TonB-linked outer membrane protein [Prolixibacteraceae bacterium]